MRIHDARPVAGRLTLDGEGLALVEHRSAVKDFYDEDELRRVYYPEAERLVAEATGASRVLVFDHMIRRRVAGGIRSFTWDATPAGDQCPQPLYGKIRPAAGPRLDGRGSRPDWQKASRAGVGYHGNTAERFVRARTLRRLASVGSNPIRIQGATPRLPPTRTPLLLTLSAEASISVSMHQLYRPRTQRALGPTLKGVASHENCRIRPARTHRRTA